MTNKQTTVNKYSDVVCLISSRRRPGSSQWWWKVRATEDILYAIFDTRDPDLSLRERACIAASSAPTKAVAVTRDATHSVTWVSPFEPPFSAPSHLPVIKRSEIQTIRQIKRGVDVVEYDGWRYIHKYMTVSSTRLSFEQEIQNYTKTAGSPFVAKLHRIVAHEDECRGLLIELIDGFGLDNVSLTFKEKYHISGLILEGVTDFEKRGFYPQDLKCCNIMLRNADHALFVVDLGGGLTEGMYRPEAARDIARGEMVAKDMLYVLGRTLWELWGEETPPKEHRVPVDDNLPHLIQRIVRDCCSLDTLSTVRVADIWGKYKDLLEAERYVSS